MRPVERVDDALGLRLLLALLFAEPARDSIGVSEKLTSSETAIANAIVRPKRVQEAADDAAHERDRQEHGHERERRREDGEADLLRRVDRRLERLDLLLLDEPEDVLEDDDGVVDDDADREREREQRDGVEREAHRAHERERADDRDRDRDRRDDRARTLPRKRSTTSAARKRAEDEVLLHGVDAGRMNCELSRTTSVE